MSYGSPASSLLFLAVPVTRLGPSLQSSTPCQQTFSCCTVYLVWLALGARQIPYAPPPFLPIGQKPKNITGGLCLVVGRRAHSITDCATSNAMHSACNVEARYCTLYSRPLTVAGPAVPRPCLFPQEAGMNPEGKY